MGVHQDGSCNGLQHYAALGRDVAGGEQVNLVGFDTPQDVYIGVAKQVAALVASDAQDDAAPHHELAVQLNGLVTRKVAC